MPYEIAFAESIKAQLRGLTAQQRATVLDAVAQQLTHEPEVETRNRKLLRTNPLAPWELRIGELRVFYEVEIAGEGSKEGAPGTVWILAVGQKRGNKLYIAGREVHL